MRDVSIDLSSWPLKEKPSPYAVRRAGVEYGAKSEREAARYAGIPYSTFRRKAREGVLPASWGVEVRVGDEWLKTQRGIGRHRQLTALFDCGQEVTYPSYADFAYIFGQTSGAVSKAFSESRGWVPRKFEGVVWMDNGHRRIFCRSMG